MHRLVDPAAVGDEGKVDGSERCDDSPTDAGLLGNFTDRGLLGRLTGFDMSLRQRPAQPAAPVVAADERGPGLAVRVVDDEATC